MLNDGSQIKIKVSIDFHEKYGLKLSIVDIDPSYTLGIHELSKQKIIERLEAEDAFEKNKALNLGPVIQKVAIVSSETAAGYQDFLAQLTENIYGYSFDLILLSSAVQGSNMEREIVASLDHIKEEMPDVDLIAIIRGGGSKLDLSGFDNYQIAKRISNLGIPVLVGIGHEIDQTITDLVSHSSVKTPTAAAEFILSHNALFESNLNREWEQIRKSSLASLNVEKEKLLHIQSNAIKAAEATITQHNNAIVNLLSKIKHLSKSLINQNRLSLEYSDKIIKGADLKQILKRGFSIISQDKKVITRASNFNAKQEVSIEFYDGTIKTNNQNE